MRRIIRPVVIVFLVGLSLSALVIGAEPDKPKPANDPSGMKEFEGLGFSVGPKGGGIEVEEVSVITPESPIGQELIGKKAGARFKFHAQEYRIVSVR